MLSSNLTPSTLASLTLTPLKTNMISRPLHVATPPSLLHCPPSWLKAKEAFGMHESPPVGTSKGFLSLNFTQKTRPALCSSLKFLLNQIAFLHPASLPSIIRGNEVNNTYAQNYCTQFFTLTTPSPRPPHIIRSKFILSEAVEVVVVLFSTSRCGRGEGDNNLFFHPWRRGFSL